MNTKIVPVLIGFILLALVGGVLFLQSGTGEKLADTPIAASGDSFSMAEVAAHADATSCWSVIDGSVYDLSDWISQHPGGARAILGLCGVDGSEAFHEQHGTADRQADILADYRIGALEQ